MNGDGLTRYIGESCPLLTPTRYSTSKVEPQEGNKPVER